MTATLTTREHQLVTLFVTKEYERASNRALVSKDYRDADASAELLAVLDKLAA